MKTSALLADVHTPRTMEHSREDVKFGANVIDLPPGMHRGQKSVKDFSLAAQADIIF